MTAVRDLSARTPLRVKLVAALTVLVALALLVTGFAASRALRGYLVDRVDRNLVASAQRPDAFAQRPDAEGRPFRRPDEYVFQVSGPQGGVVIPFSSTSAGASPPALPRVTAALVAERGGRPFTAPAVSGSARWRVLLVPVRAPAFTGFAAVAAPLADVDSTVRHLIGIELVVGLAVLLGLVVVGYGVVRSSLRPLVEVEATAEAIAAGDLSQRVPERDPRTEVGSLSRSLNAMLGQIESAFLAQQASEATARQSEERMRRFVADASHELRTPLTSIRGFAELYRQGAVPDAAELDRVMRRVEDEAARMGLLVEDLLMLARLDQQRPLERHPVDLLRLARDVVDDARALAPDRDVQLEVVTEPPVVLGDDARLRQVFANLMSNALRHTPDGTPIRVRLGADRPTGLAAVEVVDAGPGLTEEQSARVFERFYRVDTARSRADGGAGLGLSIVAALVAAHGGRVEVDSQPGGGATFRVLLPLEAAA
jgi:two-component system OmpR family sensor kinase